MAFGKKRDNTSGLIPECGAIFMSNRATKKACFTKKSFGLPSSYSNFVNHVKAGMLLFLFEYEKRELYGVYQACRHGELNCDPKAASSVWHQFPAQVKFETIWHCEPLPESEFRAAIKDNYYSPKKFHFGLSRDQVRQLLFLFSDKKIKDERLTRLIPGSDHYRSLETHVTDDRTMDNDRYGSEMGRKYIHKDVSGPRVLTKYNGAQRNIQCTFDGTFMANDTGIHDELDKLSNRFGVSSTGPRVAGDGCNITGDLDHAGQDAAGNSEHVFSAGCSRNSSPAVGGEFLTRYAAEFAENRAQSDNWYYDESNIRLDESKDSHRSMSGLLVSDDVENDTILSNSVKFDHNIGFNYRPITSHQHLQSCHAARNPSNFASGSIYKTDTPLLHAGATKSDPITFDFHQQNFHGEAIFCGLPTDSHDSMNPDFFHNASHHTSPGESSRALLKKLSSRSYVEPDSPNGSGRSPGSASLGDIGHMGTSLPLSYHGIRGRNVPFNCAKYSESGGGKALGFENLQGLEGTDAFPVSESSVGYRRNGRWEGIGLSAHEFSSIMNPLPVSEPSVGYKRNGRREGIGLSAHEPSSIMNALPLSEPSVGYKRNGRREGIGLSAHEPTSIMNSHGSEFVHSTVHSYKSDPVHLEIQNNDALRSNVLIDEVSCHPIQGKSSVSRTSFIPEIDSSYQERKLHGNVYSDSGKECSVFSRLSRTGIEADDAEHTDQERRLCGSSNFNSGKDSSILSPLNSADIDVGKADHSDQERKLFGSVKLDSGKDNSVFSRLSYTENGSEKAEHSGCDSGNIDLMVDEVMGMLTNHYRSMKKAQKRKPLARSDDGKFSRLGKHHTLPEDPLMVSTSRNLDGDKIEVDRCQMNVEKPQINFKRRSEIQKPLLETIVNSFGSGSQESVTEKQPKRRKLVRPNFGNKKTLLNKEACNQDLVGKDESQSTDLPAGGCCREHDLRVGGPSREHGSPVGGPSREHDSAVGGCGREQDSAVGGCGREQDSPVGGCCREQDSPVGGCSREPDSLATNIIHEGNGCVVVASSAAVGK